MTDSCLTLDDFTGAVGEPFELEGSEFQLRLIEASELPDSGRTGGSFRLEFSGPPEPVLGQAIYRLRRDGRSHDIFIVPIGREPDGIRYEAVFF